MLGHQGVELLERIIRIEYYDFAGGREPPCFLT